MFPALEPGTILAHKYRLEMKLGQGAYAVVYRACDLLINKPVVLKILHPQLVRNAAQRQAFLAEARLVASFVHPRIVPLREIECRGDYLFMVMEYIAGLSLENLLQQGPLKISQALDITKRLLRILSDLHQAGLLHRDIKPSNILVRDNGEVYLLDLGLALWQEEMGRHPNLAGMGSWAYLSPEQAVGDPLDARADLYAVGVCLYRMLTGRLPLVPTGSNFMAQLLQVEPRPPSYYSPHLPVALDQMLAQALAKERSQRYASARQWLEQLQTMRLANLHPSAVGRWIRAVVSVLLSLAALGWWLVYDEGAAGPSKSAALVEQIESAMRQGAFAKVQTLLQQAAQAGVAVPLIEELQVQRRLHQLIYQAWQAARQGRYRQADLLLAQPSSQEWFAALLATERRKIKLYQQLRAYRQAAQRHRYQAALSYLEQAARIAVVPQLAVRRGQLYYHIHYQAYQQARQRHDYTQALVQARQMLVYSSRPHHDQKLVGELAQLLKQPRVRLQVDTPSPDAVLASRVLRVSGRANAPLQWLRVNGQEVSFRDDRRQVWQVEVVLQEGRSRSLLFQGQDQLGRALEPHCLKVAVDVTPPHIVVTAKQCELTKQRVLIKGRAWDNQELVGVWINQVPVRWQSPTGAWQVYLPAHEGLLTIKAVAQDRAGHQQQVYTRLRIDTQPPQLSITSPQPQAHIFSTHLVVRGWARDPAGIQKVMVNGQPAKLMSNDKGSWQLELVCRDLPGQEAWRTIEVVATDKVGHQRRMQRKVYLSWWPWAQTQRVAQLRAHHTMVWGLGYSPDGRRLAVAANDRLISLWDVATARRLGLEPGGIGGSFTIKVVPGIRLLRYLFNSNYLSTEHIYYAVGYGGGCWEVSRRACTNFSCTQVRGEWPSCVTYHPRPPVLAAGYADGQLRLWMPDESTPIQRIDSRHGSIYCVAFSPDGKQLASSGADGLIRLWSLPELVLQAVLRGHRLGVTSLAFGPQGAVLLSGSRDKSLKLWNLHTGSLITTLARCHTAPICAVAVAPDGRSLASGDRSGLVILWAPGKF